MHHISLSLRSSVAAIWFILVANCLVCNDDKRPAPKRLLIGSFMEVVKTYKMEMRKNLDG